MKRKRCVAWSSTSSGCTYSRNLTKWWSDCRGKDAQATGIDVFGHKSAKALDNFLGRNGERFDYDLFDTPGEVTPIVVHFV